MRLLQLQVANDRRDDIRDALEDLDLEYTILEEGGDRDSSMLNVPLPAGAIDGVLTELHENGLDEDRYVGMINMEAAMGVDVEEITGRFAEGPRGKRGITHRELRAKVEDLRPGRVTYAVFAALAGAVATAGLLLDSSIVIVGAMVIAPFVGSLLATSVGAVVDDSELLADSITTQLLGLAAAYVSALAVAVLVQSTGVVPSSVVVGRIDQIALFRTPNLLAITIAVCAGAAGALALAEDLPTAVAGVAVAAAIVPSAATSAIGLAWGQPLVALGALVLLLVNAICINVTAYASFFVVGYRSDLLSATREGINLSVKTGAYALVIGIFVLVIGLTIVATVQHLAFEGTAKAEVEQTLDRPEYDDLELVSISTEYSDGGVIDEPRTVTVTIVRFSGEEYPLLDDRLRQRISAATGDEAIVELEIVEYRRSGPETESAETVGLTTEKARSSKFDRSKPDTPRFDPVIAPPSAVLNEQEIYP